MSDRNRIASRGERRHATKGERAFLAAPSDPGGWTWFTSAMLGSPAYRALSRAGHQAIACLCIENAAHRGLENGRLKVGYDNFVAAGIHRGMVAQTLDELTQLGFVRRTEKGRKGFGSAIGVRASYRLTFLGTVGDRSGPATNDWKAIDTDEQAEQVAAAVREAHKRAARKAPRHNLDISTQSRTGTKVRNPAPGKAAA